MDKIGNIGEIKTGDFYTRDDWGKKINPPIGVVQKIFQELLILYLKVKMEDGVPMMIQI